MQARFYAPWYGRFLSPDPARDQHFEETQSWNIYSYVQNNPVMMTDPTGEVAQIAMNGNKVTITVPVRFGAGTSPEMRARFISAVQSRWTGNFGSYSVTTTVVEGGKVNGQTNTVNFYDQPVGRSQVDESGTVASIFTKEFAAGPVNSPNPQTQEPENLDQTMAHEAGHLMNISDGYHDVSNWTKDGKLEVKSVPNDKNTQPGVPASATGKRSNSDLMVNDRNPKAKPTKADIKEATLSKRNDVKKKEEAK